MVAKRVYVTASMYGEPWPYGSYDRLARMGGVAGGGIIAITFAGESAIFLLPAT